MHLFQFSYYPNTVSCWRLRLIVGSLFVSLHFFSLYGTSVAQTGRIAEPQQSAPRQQIIRPEQIGLSAKELKDVDGWIEEAVTKGDFPGCVLCVGTKKSIAILKAYGNRQVLPNVEPMKVDTIFDLASLTKPLATGLSIMHLHQQKKFRLEEPVGKYLPEFQVNGKEKVHFIDLLTHQSGLIPDNSIRDYQDGEKVAWEKIFALPLRYGLRKKFKYSDVGFQVLGKVIEQISGQPLDQYAKTNLYQPLGLIDTEFNPPKEKRKRIAPADKRNGKWIQGEVHDPRSYRLGGVAGHAGLFSSAPELAKIAQLILNGGRYGGKEILKKQSIEKMSAAYNVPGGGIRGLSWDKQSAYSSNRGKSFSERAIGHGGFTGTVFWVDPEKDLFFILLSNRLHPDGKGQVNRLAGKIATLIGQAKSK